MEQQITKEFLIDEYHNKNKRLKTIAEEINVSYTTIHKYIRKYNIKRKDRKGKNNSKYRNGKYCYSYGYREYRNLLKKDKCSICKQTEGQLDIHHIDFNHTNDVIENLQVLCSSCHSTIHRNYEWQNKRNKEKIKRNNKGRFTKNESNY